MGMHQMLGPISGSSSDYQITRSLRFNSADSAYLGRTFGSGGNRRTWTWSGWFKRQQTEGMTNMLFATYTDNSNRFYIGIQGNSDKLLLFGRVGGTDSLEILSDQVFRDFSAWYHMVVAIDSTQSSSSDRVKVYLNGSQISLATTTALGQNVEPYLNSASPHHLGWLNGSSRFNGYQAEVHFVDGQALTPSSFGEFDDDNNWIPKEVNLTYGTNGFYLNFSDNSSNSALGTDSSGNNNTFTVYNLSVAAGTGNDSLLDSPTNGTQSDTGAGGEVSGNYATFNPLDSLQTHSVGNLEVVSDGATLPRAATSTIAVESGKWYAEVEVEAESGGQKSIIGVIEASYSGIIATSGNIPNSNTDSVFVFGESGQKFIDGVSTSYGSGIAPGDVIGIALNLDDDEITFYKNVNSMGTITTKSFNGAYKIAVGRGASSGSTTYILNTGQRAFANNAPSGFKALCTANLPTPTIADGSDYFDTKLYTGNGSSQSITGLEFSPDLVWLKSRASAFNNFLIDTIRGNTKLLKSNSSAAETTTTTAITSFDSNGFSLGSGSQTNANNDSMVAWTWDAGSSTVSNNNGSITSNVRANTSAGFSIVSYTGTGVAGTIGHGLNAKPSVVLIKTRDSTDSWFFYTDAIDGSLDYNQLEGSGSFGNSGLSLPTSNVFYVGSSAGSNKQYDEFIVYCFAPVAGYSAFGSYTANGSSDGPFVHTGFAVAWLLTKRTNSTGSWEIHDLRRPGYNPQDERLLADGTNSEASGNDVDFLSNGFKIRNTFSGMNGSNGDTYLYMAFAEHPLKTARAR